MVKTTVYRDVFGLGFVARKLLFRVDDCEDDANGNQIKDASYDAPDLNARDGKHGSTHAQANQAAYSSWDLSSGVKWVAWRWGEE